MTDIKQSNVSDATIADFYRKALAAKRTHEEKVEEAASLDAIYRAVLKEAKKAGVDTTAMARVLNERNKDPDELLKADREYLRLRVLTGGIQPEQLDLFAPMFRPDLSPEVSATLTLEHVYEDGVTAGKAGSDRENNPHDAGSEEWDTWDRAWLKGQESNLPAQAPIKPKKGKLTVVKDA